MLSSKEVPNSFLENINMVNTATNFFNTNNKNISDINTLYNRTTNDFSLFNTNNNKINTLNINKKNYNINKLNEENRFLWKEINNLNYNEIEKDENALENPVLKNILNTNINENEIQNIPENYLVNLIHTLQGLANNAIKNKNNLEIENKKLYHDLEEMKTNNEYLHQNNMKINQKLIDLNKQKMKQKNTQNFNIHDLLEGNNTYMKNKKFYCKVCTNKKFKSQKYLDEHIARRHPDYLNRIMKNNENYKESNVNVELFRKKLNDMKNYFDNLIYKSMKKIQYIKINEKINNLQNLFEITKNMNNKNIDINTNINIDTNIKNQKEEIIIKNSNNSINSEEKEKEKKTETENSSNMEQNETALLKKQFENLEKRHGNFFHNFLLLRKKLKFIRIKNFFDQPDTQITQQRSKKKRKTQNNRSKIIPEISKEQINEETKKLEFSDEKGEKSEEHEKLKSIAKKENKNYQEENQKNQENNDYNDNDNENDNDNKYLDKTEEEKKEITNTHIKYNKENIESSSKLKLKDENVINFSDEEDEKNQVIRQFYYDYKNRDGHFSTPEEKYFLKTVLPKDYNFDKNEINNLVKDNIDSKLKKFHLNNKSPQEMRNEMMKIYYETIDFQDKYNDFYLYNYQNLSTFLGIRELIKDANNNNFYLEQSFFETVHYRLEESEDVSFRAQPQE